MKCRKPSLPLPSSGSFGVSRLTDYFARNRALWDAWTELHEKSDFYDLDAFRAGELTLREIERQEVGDVSGKTLLHLQCHFGLDSLSWARLGARVTGVDFSDRAIQLARSLAVAEGIDARFLCANIYDLPTLLDETFDLVFSSYGVIPWLPDLKRWAELIARYLRPGGRFHLVEFHPLTGMLDDEGRRLVNPYFHETDPRRYEGQGSYAAPSTTTRESFEWPHSLGDVIDSLLEAGLTLRSFREFPFSPYGCWPYLEEREPGRWYVRGSGPDLPLTFSICALR
jgi:SAM-dependent methyltransferase